MNSRTKAGKVLVWGLVALALTALLLFAMFDGTFGADFSDFFGVGSLLGAFGVRYADAEAYQPGGGTVPSDAISALEIHWVAGTAELLAYDGDAIRFEETSSVALSDAQRMRYLVKNGKLILQYQKSGIGGKTPSKNLSVWIPREIALRAIRLEGVSARIEGDFGEWPLEKLTIGTVSGDVSLRGVHAGEAASEAVSANVSLAGFFAHIGTQSVSGRTELTLSEMPTRIDSDTVSGDVTLFVPWGAGFRAELSSVSGALRCDFGEYTGKKAVEVGSGSERARLSFDSVSGNVTIERIAPMAGAESAQPIESVETSAPPADGNAVPASGRKF